MASSILLRNIAAVDDKRIVLANSNFVRLPGIGSSWNKIRVAVLLSMTDTGSNLTSTPKLAVGICSGYSNIFLDATTTHWCGFLSNSATWSRIAGPPVGYNIGAALPWFAAKRIGSTTTINGSAVNGISNTVLYDAATANRTALYVTITKGSPNFTFSIFSRNTPVNSDVTPATFVAQAEILAPTITNHGPDNGTGGTTVAIDEVTNGTFDHVAVAWDRTTPNIEVSDLKAVRLS